jgi:DNA-binding response OmpR family regulator
MQSARYPNDSTVVDNCEDLIGKLEDCSYDLVVVMNSDGIDGLSSTKKIREYNDAVPIILIGDGSIRGSAYDYGATHFFDKRDRKKFRFAIDSYLREDS